MKKFKKIYVEITNICNLNCQFCPNDKLEKREMTLQEFEIILNKIDDFTDYLYLHVKGEPLLHSMFKDILLLAKKYNKQVNITTNGTLLKKRVDDIINSKIVRQVNISLQSLINIDYLDDILKSAEKLAKNNIQVVYRMWASNKYQNLIVEKLENRYQTKLDKDNIKLMDNLYLNKDTEFIWPSLNNDFITDIGTCYGLRTHIGILVDGTVIPCCLDSKGVINLGNIYEESLEEILKKERCQKIKTNFQNNKLVEELCQKCGFREKI